ncbi:hypothetical protein DY245_33740 [Streptomyces inhibens]|uniref:Alcohol dehydrogenase-like N-terminal domain-containing protein n=2 Tax=Streptomyces inhibens TaxID=2293571 RepID=A0A371PUZ6_STRIH|nr:alcohol dehydrogenase catalytic domain-containing protein [Streptomyces inhibens]REK86295.1 hypothetical protein DY245_33740 [Streptomyces inhibens]
MPVDPEATLGHEAVGVVHALGSAVEGLSDGERVAVSGVTPCSEGRFPVGRCPAAVMRSAGPALLRRSRLASRCPGHFR